MPGVRVVRHLKDRLFRLATALCLIDGVVGCAAISLGLILRVLQRGEFEAFRASFVDRFSPAIAWVAGGAVVYCALLAFFRVYEPANLYRMHFTLRKIAQSALLWPLAMLAINGLLQYNELAPRLGLLYCAGTLLAAGMLTRVFTLGILMHPRVRRSTRARVVVVGWNEQAASLRHALHSDHGQLREVIGCVCNPGGGFAAAPDQVKVLGSYDDLPRLVAAHQVDGVILAEIHTAPHEIRRLIEFCQREYLSFHLVPEYFPALGSRLEAKAVNGVPLLGVSRLPLDSAPHRALKRALDVAGALVGLVVAAPLIGLFGLLVYLESPGPVIYRQKRTTRGGRTFTIFKIRSMRLDAESKSGAVWCKQDDPRRLRVGAFMRRTNIDELPQFWNVLKGDMSLVGPRPERPELIERFKNEIPNYNVRHSVRAGVTGWAAVHGLRGDTDLRQRVEYDIYYIEHWSVLLDLYCILATFFKRDGAH
ncbi:sugar transferase [Congregicoccus parvus]|uniref:sugar transferase n=1 Tax=Congregicoccus parvus TaxID=3081749 RepID=UPI003FA5AC98